MITLKVTPDNGDEYTVTATSRDVLTWEKTTKGNKSFVDLVENPNLIDLYKVAHLASWRQGLTTLNFQDFEASCEVTGVGDEDAEPDPTQSGQSPESSSTSPSEPESHRPSGRKRGTARS